MTIFEAISRSQANFHSLKNIVKSLGGRFPASTRKSNAFDIFGSVWSRLTQVASLHDVISIGEREERRLVVVVA